jgi:hypothetical protein
MPPLKTYEFESVSDAQTTIVIYAYDEISAKWRMEQHVKEPSNFRLK